MYLPPKPFFGRLIVLSGVYRSSVLNFVPVIWFPFLNFSEKCSLKSLFALCIFAIVIMNNIDMPVKMWSVRQGEPPESNKYERWRKG